MGSSTLCQPPAAPIWCVGLLLLLLGVGDEENQAINSSRESVMCNTRSCITNGALHLIVNFVALLANPLFLPQILRRRQNNLVRFVSYSYSLSDEGNRLRKRQTSICPNTLCWKSFRC